MKRKSRLCMGVATISRVYVQKKITEIPLYREKLSLFFKADLLEHSG